jgi:hypothetical protein
MSNEIFLVAVCIKTKKPFFVQFFKGADDVWVRTNAYKELQVSNNSQVDPTEHSIDLEFHRISPRYACPYCGDKKCGSPSANTIKAIEIILIFDTSGSMGKKEIEQSKIAAKKLIKGLCLDMTHVGMVVFADKDKPVMRKLSNSDEIIERAIGEFDSSEHDVGGGTSAIPFNTSYKLFSSKEDAKRYFILLTDGEWYDQESAIKEANEFKQMGVEIIAVGFGSADIEFLKSVASSSDKVLMTNLDKLANEFSKFTLSIIKGAGQ